jgi:hypothetical protein
MGIILGAFQAWNTRHAMNADGISYLDIGDAYFRGDWQNAINAYWSPLYSWILGLTLSIFKPSPYYEFTVVHFVNFLIYLWALGCFHFFLLQLIRYHRYRTGEGKENHHVSFPEWAWIALGYCLFIRSSLDFITISSVTPDMCLSGFVYLALGILLRISRGATNYLTFVFLGIILGFGYLTKTVMFPLAFIFVLVSIFSINNLRKALPRAIIVLIIFFFIAGPFIIAISNAKGRITYGDAGRFNYWWHTNGYHIYHWDGTPPGSGTPRHPPRKIFNMPAIYEFGTPIGGTYPLWYDPSYWYDGIKISFDLKRQLIVIKEQLKGYYHIFYPSYSIFIFGSLILYLMGRKGWLVIKDIAEHWVLFLPVMAALGMYSLINVDSRYVGPFIPLLWLGIFSGIRLPDSEESRRLLKWATIIMVLITMLITTRNLIKDKYPGNHLQWQVANTLNQMGVLPGDKIASIGYSHSHFWARLARVRIIAEISHKEANNFWNADSSVKSKVIATFSKIGAKAIVTEIMPSCTSSPPIGWKKLGNTGYYAYILEK